MTCGSNMVGTRHLSIDMMAVTYTNLPLDLNPTVARWPLPSDPIFVCLTLVRGDSCVTYKAWKVYGSNVFSIGANADRRLRW